MFATKQTEIKAVLEKMTKRQRIALRQEFGSMPIQGISYDETDGYIVVQFGSDRPIVQHSFFIRKTGRIAHKVTSQIFTEWQNKWSKA